MNKPQNFNEREEQITNTDVDIYSEEFSKLPIEKRRELIQEKLNNDINAAAVRLEALKANNANEKEILLAEKQLEYLKDQKNIPERVEKLEEKEAIMLGKKLETKGKGDINNKGASLTEKAKRLVFTALAAANLGALAPKEASATEEHATLADTYNVSVKSNAEADKEAKMVADLEKELGPEILKEVQKEREKALIEQAKATKKHEIELKKAQEKALADQVKATKKHESDLKKAHEKEIKQKQEAEAEWLYMNKHVLEDTNKVMAAVQQNANKAFIYNSSEGSNKADLSIYDGKTGKFLRKVKPGQLEMLGYDAAGSIVFFQSDRGLRDKRVIKGGGTQPMLFNGLHIGPSTLSEALVPYLVNDLKGAHQILMHDIEIIKKIEGISAPQENNKKFEEKALPVETKVKVEAENKEQNKKEEKSGSLDFKFSKDGKDTISLEDGSSATIDFNANNKAEIEVKLKYDASPEFETQIKNLLKDDYLEILKNGKNEEQINSATALLGDKTADMVFLRRVVDQLSIELNKGVGNKDIFEKLNSDKNILEKQIELDKNIVIEKCSNVFREQVKEQSKKVVNSETNKTNSDVKNDKKNENLDIKSEKITKTTADDLLKPNFEQILKDANIKNIPEAVLEIRKTAADIYIVNFMIKIKSKSQNPDDIAEVNKLNKYNEAKKKIIIDKYKVDPFK